MSVTSPTRIDMVSYRKGRALNSLFLSTMSKLIAQEMKEYRGLYM